MAQAAERAAQERERAADAREISLLRQTITRRITARPSLNLFVNREVRTMGDVPVLSWVVGLDRVFGERWKQTRQAYASGWPLSVWKGQPSWEFRAPTYGTMLTTGGNLLGFWIGSPPGTYEAIESATKYPPAKPIDYVVGALVFHRDKLHNDRSNCVSIDPSKPNEEQFVVRPYQLIRLAGAYNVSLAGVEKPQDAT